MKPLLIILVSLSIGCSINHDLAGSFNKRKFTKGYFRDAIGDKPTIMRYTKNEPKIIGSHSIKLENNLTDCTGFSPKKTDKLQVSNKKPFLKIKNVQVVNLIPIKTPIENNNLATERLNKLEDKDKKSGIGKILGTIALILFGALVLFLFFAGIISLLGWIGALIFMGVCIVLFGLGYLLYEHFHKRN